MGGVYPPAPPGPQASFGWCQTVLASVGLLRPDQPGLGHMLDAAEGRRKLQGPEASVGLHTSLHPIRQDWSLASPGGKRGPHLLREAGGAHSCGHCNTKPGCLCFYLLKRLQALQVRFLVPSEHVSVPGLSHTWKQVRVHCSYRKPCYSRKGMRNGRGYKGRADGFPEAGGAGDGCGWGGQGCGQARPAPLGALQAPGGLLPGAGRLRSPGAGVPGLMAEFRKFCTLKLRHPHPQTCFWRGCGL